MLQGRGGFLAAAGLVALGAVTSHCTSTQAPPAAPVLLGEMKPAVSVKELMQHLIDPIADNIFDAVATDVSASGTVETVPKTDDDWAKVQMGAVALAESVNLLKIPRLFAPPGDLNNSSGPNAPELSPDAIKAKVDGDHALWNSHAEELRAVAVEVMGIVKRKDAGALFDAGGKLDKACEHCHLEYWYPGDKKDVLEDEQKRAGYVKKK